MTSPRPSRPDWPPLPDTARVDLPGIGLVAGPQDACLAVEATLLRWLPAYVAALKTAGVHDLEPLRRSEQLPSADTASAYATPSLFLSSPGISGRPAHIGGPNGSMRASWTVNIALIDRGKSWRDTQSRVRWWVTLARTLLLQQNGLDGAAAATEWIGEDYASGPADGAQTLGIGALSFTVTLDSVVDLSRRPELVDPTDPGAPNLPPTDQPTVAEGGVLITTDQEGT